MSPLIQGCTSESIIFVLDAAATFDVTSTVMVTQCRGYRRVLGTIPSPSPPFRSHTSTRDCHPPETSSLMYVHISVGDEPCQELPSGDRLLRCILACSAPLAAEQPAVRAPSPSFGRVRDRQAIRGAGASTEPAAGLPCVDLLLAPPVKLVVVAPPLTRKTRSRFADVLPANQSFSEWRDPDSNRGHHEFLSHARALRHAENSLR